MFLEACYGSLGVFGESEKSLITLPDSFKEDRARYQFLGDESVKNSILTCTRV